MLHFEWDPMKALTNQRKHGVRFEDATKVFDDPYAVTELDRIDARGEQRWTILGSTGGTTLLLVVHTVREFGFEELVRIISARGADRKERRRYEQARAQITG